MIDEIIGMNAQMCGCPVRFFPVEINKTPLTAALVALLTDKGLKFSLDLGFLHGRAMLPQEARPVP